MHPSGRRFICPRCSGPHFATYTTRSGLEFGYCRGGYANGEYGGCSFEWSRDRDSQVFIQEEET